jgi:hypothetical protein
MRRRDRKRLEEARLQQLRPPPDPEQKQAQTSSLLRRLLGFYLFHKIFGGNS